ncbi:MAG: HAMP domain-containing sensor histidine kinase, partial [Candidatus Lokiarchaeota archaeon]
FEKFVSNIIHQLRTPLSVIQMSLKYLERNRERINSELEKKIFNGVYRNLKSIDDLIKDLITFTQLNDSSINLNIERFSLSNEISESIESMELLAKEKNIKIVDNINKNIELNADKNKIKQVFQILIVNAIKYSKRDSEIIVNSNFNRLNEKNVNELIIEFVDHGIGINNEDLPHLFERFYRSKRVAHIEGIGLGLSIAKTIIQMHGGKIHAKRNLDRGTTFSIVLPNSRIS